MQSRSSISDSSPIHSHTKKLLVEQIISSYSIRFDLIVVVGKNIRFKISVFDAKFINKILRFIFLLIEIWLGVYDN